MVTIFRSMINQPDVKRHSGLSICNTFWEAPYGHFGDWPLSFMKRYSLHYYFHPIMICIFTSDQSGAGDGKAAGNNWVSKLPWFILLTKCLPKGEQKLYAFTTGGLALPIHVSGKQQHRTVLQKTRLRNTSVTYLPYGLWHLHIPYLLESHWNQLDLCLPKKQKSDVKTHPYKDVYWLNN